MLWGELNVDTDRPLGWIRLLEGEGLNLRDSMFCNAKTRATFVILIMCMTVM